MTPITAISSRIASAIEIQRLMLEDAALLFVIEAVVAEVTAVFQNGGKVLFCGNGGSAADAQHLAAELSGRFYLDRKPLFAEALHVNSSFLTAVANDYGFDAVFSRSIEAMGKPGDVLFALSTSGNSPNILAAMRMAQQNGLKVVGMTGLKGQAMEPWSDFFLQIPSSDTPRIQEAHLLVGHIICEMVERALFK